MPRHPKQDRPAPVVGEHIESDFSDADLASISSDDLRARSEALNEAQETFESLAYVSTPKIPCHECGGRGVTAAGSFGDIECPNCGGKRVVERPGNPPIEAPPFAALRAGITAYGDALADRALPAGHRNKRGLALPPASTVPSLESLRNITAELVEKHKAISAPAVDPKLLPERQARNDEDGAGDFDDAELDQAEADADEE